MSAQLTTLPQSRVSDQPMRELGIIREWALYLSATGKSEATQRSYRYGLLRFLSESDVDSLATITEAGITGFLASVGPRSSARSVYFRALRSFFSWAAERGYVASDPTALVKVRNPVKPPVVALSEEELIRVLVAAAWRSPRRGWALLLCYAIGTRRMELAAIAPGDVDDSSVHLRITKGDRPRRVPLSPTAKAAIEGLRPWWNGTILGDVTPQTITRWAQDAARDAGLVRPKRKAHVLRSTFATRLLERQTPISVVSELLGHSDLGVTSRYLSVSSSDKQAAVDKL